MDYNIVTSQEGQVYKLGGSRVRVIEDGTRTRNELSIIESEVLPGSITPLEHIHHAHEEIFILTAGSLEFLVNGTAVTLTKGDSVTIPIGIRHTFRNRTDAPARMITTCSPAAYVHYFEDIAELIKGGNLNPQANEEVMKKYDTEVVR